MSHCFSRELLLDFVSGRTAPDRGNEIAEHVSDCVDCQTTIEELLDGAQLRELLRSVSDNRFGSTETAISAEFRDRLYAVRDLASGPSLERLWISPDRHGPHPAVLGRFHLREQLGSGGFGVVFLAEDTQLNRPVALKLPRSPALLDSSGRARFFLEAKAAAALHHPHIVAVYDAGECDGICYLASAYCPGETLAHWLHSRESPATPVDAAQIVLALTRAIEFAHQHSVIHRDIKPQNVLLDPTTRFHDLPFTPKLTDFGIAKIMDPGSSDTATEILLGTPRYMAPELAAGRRDQLGPACDIYALGVVLYELITKRVPIDGAGHADTLRRVVADEPVSPRTYAAQIPRDLEAICMKCLEKAPGRRYSCAAALAEDLERYLQHQPTVVRPIGNYEKLMRWVRRRPAAAGLIGVVVAASLILGVLNFNLRQSNANLEKALEDAHAARARAEHSEEETQQLLYISDMRLAGQAWEAGDTPEVVELLRRHIPKQNALDRRGLEWRYLWNRSQNVSRIVDKHSDALYFLRISPDGRLIASAGKDAAIRLYDLASNDLIWSIESGQHEVNGVAFSPDGQRLASAGDDGTICIWNTQDGRQLLSFHAHPNLAYNALFTQDGNTLISCGNDTSIRIWNSRTGQPIRSIEAHSRMVHAIALSPDGKRLASVGGDDYARIFDWTTGKTVGWQRFKLPDLTSVSFSKEGPLAAIGGYDGIVRVWDVVSDRIVAEAQQLDKIHSVAISDDGRHVVSGDSAGIVHVWEIPDALVSGKSDEPGQLELKRNWHAHDGRVYTTVFSAGDRLLTCGEDGAIRSWSLGVSDSPRVFSRDEAVDFAFVGRSELLAIVYLDRICVCNRSTGNVIRELGRIEAPDYWASLECSPDGAILAAITHEDMLCVWDVSSGALRWSLDFRGHGRSPIRFSSDGHRLAVFAGTSDDAIRMFDAATGETLSSLRVHLGRAIQMSFASDEKQIAVTADRTIALWDVTRSERKEIGFAHAFTINDNAFSPDGSLLATAGADREVKLWDPASGSAIATLSGHRAPVQSVVFSPDGRSLVTADRDGVIKIWHVPAHELTLDVYRHPEGVSKVRVAPDSRQLACHTINDKVLVFELGDLPP